MIRILFPKNLFISSSSSSFRPLLLQVSHFSASSNSPSSSRRHHDEESRLVPVSVWWDFENCNVPVDVNIYKVSHCIAEAIRAKGIKGPLQITAFGDVYQLSKTKQEALSSTGITITHIPSGPKNGADRSLLVDLLYWVSQNPPPAHLFLISGDRDFAGVLHRLRMNNYNILLASTEPAPNVLCSAATIMWHWFSLLRGENVSGKHFNHPPDGPFGSWYGYHKVPLEDPFPDAKQSTCSQTGMYESTSDLTPRGRQSTCSQTEMSESTSDLTPRGPTRITTVIKHIQCILDSFPEGIHISDLRNELTRAGINLDKDYYGHKKFSSLLLASKSRIRLLFGPDKQLYVYRGSRIPPEHFDRSLVPSRPSDDNEELNSVLPSNLRGNEENMAKDAARTTPMATPDELSVECFPEKVQQVADVANAQPTDDKLPLKETEILSSGDVSEGVPEKYTASESYSTEQSSVVVEKDGITKAEDVKPTRMEADEGCHFPNSSPVNESVVDKQTDGSAEPDSSKFGKRLTFFGWIKSWWPFWKSDGNNGDFIAHQKKMANNTKKSEANQTVDHYEEPELSDMKQTVSHSENPELPNVKQTVSHSEDPELPNVKQMVSHSEDTELQNVKQMISHSEDPELPNVKQTVSHTEEPELSEMKPTVSCSEVPKLSEQKQAVIHSEKPESSEPRQTVNHSGEQELLFSSSFWSKMESFIFSPRGSILVTQSRSRKDMVQSFQKYGPMNLSSVGENDLMQMVEFMITEKKWLEERPSRTFPFRVIPAVGKSSVGLSPGANGLRSLFQSRTSQSYLQKSSEGDVNKKLSTAHSGVSSPAAEKKPPVRLRADLLADFSKLVNEILKEHRDGYSMSLIPQRFHERYGYSLIPRKLGHQKLASLIQSLPGVRMESGLIFPADHYEVTSLLKTEVANSSNAVLGSDSELSDLLPKDDSNDGPWEELGPVSVVNANPSDLESKSWQKIAELETSVHPEYEPSVSDDDYSGSEEEDSPCLAPPEGERKPKGDVDGSSLVETLELFYSNQGEDSAKSDTGNTTASGVTDVLNPSTQSTPGTNSKTRSGENNKEKQKSSKNYLFVADPVSTKDPLVNILTSLQKTDDVKMKN